MANTDKTLNNSIMSSKDANTNKTSGANNIDSSRCLYTYYYIATIVNNTIFNESINGKDYAFFKVLDIDNLGDNADFIEYMTAKKYSIDYYDKDGMTLLGSSTTSLSDLNAIPQFHYNNPCVIGDFVKYNNSIKRCKYNYYPVNVYDKEFKIPTSGTITYHVNDIVYRIESNVKVYYRCTTEVSVTSSSTWSSVSSNFTSLTDSYAWTISAQYYFDTYSLNEWIHDEVYYLKVSWENASSDPDTITINF